MTLASPPATATPQPVADTGRDDALDLLTQAADVLRAAGREDLVGRLHHERRRVTDPLCDVLVVGEFKKGKSALVNALLNARVCAVDADAATAVPTVVRYGPTLEVRVVRSNLIEHPSAPDSSETAATPTQEPAIDDREASAGDPIELPELAQYTTDLGDGSTTSSVRSVVVEVPRQLLAQGLLLIDTPGVNGGLTSAHAAATLRALAMSDALVFVTDASQELTAPEMDFLRQAYRMCPTVVCVLAKTDFYPDWRRILELDRAHLERAGMPFTVLPVAAPLRHYALRTGDATLDQESGYPALVAHLQQHVLAAKERLGVRAAAAAVTESVSQLAARVEAEHAILVDPAGERGLVETLERAKRRTQQLRTAAAEWQQILTDRFGDMTSTVELDLAMRIRRVRDDANATIEQTDPAVGWPQFQAWLHQRANEELVEHFAKIREEADRVASAVAERFDLETQHLNLYHDLATEPSVYAVESTPQEFKGMSRSELTLVALRGSTGGAVVSGMVGSWAAIVSTALAASIAVPAGAAGAVLAAVLARRSVKSARQSEVVAHRRDAARHVQRYLEQVELVARKDSRDTMRRVHQRLRNYFRARAAEVYVSASENFEATKKAVRSDHARRRRRLEETGQELATLRDILDRAASLQREEPVPDQATAES